MNKTTIGSAIFGAATLAAVSGAAQAETLRYAIGWPPNTTATAAVETYAEKAKDVSAGDIEVKVYPLSLLNFLEANEGVRDGLADIVTILSPYYLNEFPRLNLATELAALVELRDDVGLRGPMAFTGAMLEYVMLNCPACAEEAAAQNQVYTSAASSPPYVLQCLEPTSSPDDLKGKRIRAGGAWWSRWVEAMGATTVSISINETFEALSQGVLDCTASNATELTNFSFIDVVKSINLDVPGAVFTSAVSNVNRDVWQGLSNEQRAVLLQAGATVSSQMTWNYWQEGQNNIEQAKAKGIDFTGADDALKAKSRAFIEQDIENMIASYKERFGIEDGAETVAKMRELLEKWSPLVGDVDSAEGLAELYWTEVYSKLDPATYGL